jgi:hypothetical protein
MASRTGVWRSHRRDGPVSVISTFKEAKTRGRLLVLVEAESLFNDGTAAGAFAVVVAVGVLLLVGRRDRFKIGAEGSCDETRIGARTKGVHLDRLIQSLARSLAENCDQPIERAVLVVELAPNLDRMIGVAVRQ